MFFEKFIARAIIGAACALALSACVSGNPRTLYELSRFDPLDADPKEIAIAVKADRNLHLKRGDVLLRMTLESDDRNRAFDEHFVLAITNATPAAGLARSVKADEHVLTAAIAAPDMQRFRNTQAKARNARAANATDGKGSISVSITGGCRRGVLDMKTASVRSYMRTEADGRFFPLTGEIRLADIFVKAGMPAADVPACSEAK